MFDVLCGILLLCIGYLIGRHSRPNTVEPQLTEEEETIWKRGRNANGVKAPKHADPVEYRRATGLETLFGYLFLQGKMDRLEELFQMILSADEAEQK